MQLLLPSDILKGMRRYLLRARRREIGGILMGEEIGHLRFRIVDFTVDTTSGTSSHFVRDADHHDEALSAFFERTGAEYDRFNYLGEWHSHPSFSVNPSHRDVYAMNKLVDGSGGVDFAVLLICRLKWYWRFECSTHLFVRGYVPSVVDVAIMEHSVQTKGPIQREKSSRGIFHETLTSFASAGLQSICG